MRTPQEEQALRGQAVVIAALKADMEELENLYELKQREFIEAMGEQQTYSLQDEDYTYKLTVVKGERTTVDPVSLKKSLGARAWNKLTERKLSLQKIEDAINTGALDPVVVKQSTTFNANRPYIRLSAKKREI